MCNFEWTILKVLSWLSCLRWGTLNIVKVSQVLISVCEWHAAGLKSRVASVSDSINEWALAWTDTCVHLIMTIFRDHENPSHT